MANTSKKIRALIGDGMTQAEIAKATGSTQPTISRVQRGKQQPLEPLVRAVEALHRARGLTDVVAGIGPDGADAHRSACAGEATA